MEVLIAGKDDITEDELVLMNKAVNNTPKYHTLEQHNFYAKKRYPCPYCSLGSKPVPKDKLKLLEEK